MNYRIVEKTNKKYIEINEPFTCDNDVLDVIGLCISNNVELLLLKEEVFNENFINLKSGLAGIALQKFINYRIKVSAIIEDQDKIQGRFEELIRELNKGNDFRVFNNINDAEKWILNVNTKEI